MFPQRCNIIHCWEHISFGGDCHGILYLFIHCGWGWGSKVHCLLCNGLKMFLRQANIRITTLPISQTLLGESSSFIFSSAIIEHLYVMERNTKCPFDKRKKMIENATKFYKKFEKDVCDLVRYSITCSIFFMECKSLENG